MAGFIAVLLRGLALSGQSVAIGAVAFALLVLMPAARGEPDRRRLLGRVLTVAALGAAVAAAAHALWLVIQLGVLSDTSGWPLRQVLATGYVQMSLLRILCCLGLVGSGLWLRGQERVERAWPWLAALAVAIAAGGAATSHAAGRLEHRALLLGLDFAHQLAVGVWVGGLISLIVAAFPLSERPWSLRLLKRFSATALTAVTTLVLTGAGLTAFYGDGLSGLIGTAYGMMVVTKIAVLAGLLVLGALNFAVVRRLPAGSPVSRAELQRFVEVEFGLGVTVLFAAASLTSIPPAVDVIADRASIAEVVTRFTPRWPTFASPRLEDMPLAERDAPRNAADRAWSEFNHHASGILVVAMGVLALLHATGRAGWARHWPLVFFALGTFVLLRSDPATWPLGPYGFWESFIFAEVVQHRLFVVLIFAFGAFEWMVRTGRLRSPRCALVFPMLAVVGGGLLLTHSHAALNLKEEFLIEVTHAPLGVLALVVGWSRWLELRLPTGATRLPGRLWPAALAVIGLLLLFYRES
ncbi:MAG: CopD family protein [Candidatus Rokubacteria bacterium]|nr:CopD family protein [Candidatus Rokubacteria bacterium]